MTAVLLLLASTASLLDGPLLDGFDAPLDPARWYVGVPEGPRDSVLVLPRDGWIVSRGIPDDGLRELAVRFEARGGRLEVAFHDGAEPLARPVGPVLAVPRGGGERLLVVTGAGATLDGEPLEWDGAPRGTFRLAARRGRVELLEVRVAPAAVPPPQPSSLDRQTVWGPTTPRRHHVGDRGYQRVVLPLWDVEVALLFGRAAEASCSPLAAPPRGAPVLGCLVTAGDGRALAKRAAGHPLARRDWGDETRNLGGAALAAYLASEYARFALIEQVQRAMNARVADRDDLEALVALAVLRHSENPHAALALAETRRAREALAALRRAAGDAEPASLRPDALRELAGRAARAVLGDEPPAEWPGFRFDPGDRFLTMTRAAELVR